MEFVREKQEELLQDVVDLVEDDWNEIVIDLEIDDIDGERVMSPDSYSVLDGEEAEFSLSIKVTDKFEQLKDLSQGGGWKTCHLVIKESGDFEYTYSYENTPRLDKLRAR
ncbi:hypothetical protein [Agaribacterium sp. ZY112]|uniref:hypothetical protein n=1 Tax=Agaribacterium sp. ZY112 TaxID=3233574 RepID=UPI003523691A